MAVPALDNGNESIIDRLKAEGQLTRNSGTNSLKVVIKTLDNIFNLLKESTLAQAKENAALQFQQEENKLEEERNRKSELGGRIREGAKSVGDQIMNLLRKAKDALAAAGLLAFLTFLPEFLESEFFQQAIELIENTLPMIEAFYEKILVPIGAFFKDGFTKFLRDMNNDGVLSAIMDNKMFVGIVTAIVFRKALIKFIGAILSTAFGYLSTEVLKTGAGAAIFGKAGFMGKFALAFKAAKGPLAVVAVILGLIMAALFLFDKETFDKIVDGTYKDQIIKAGKDFMQSVSDGFGRIFDALKLAVANTVGKVLSFFGFNTSPDEQATAMGISREKQIETKLFENQRAIDRLKNMMKIPVNEKQGEIRTENLKNLEAERERLQSAKANINVPVVAPSTTTFNSSIVQPAKDLGTNIGQNLLTLQIYGGMTSAFLSH